MLYRYKKNDFDAFKLELYHYKRLNLHTLQLRWKARAILKKEGITAHKNPEYKKQIDEIVKRITL
jgi:hypothetical protein